MASIAVNRKNYLYLLIFGVCATALLMDRCFMASSFTGPNDVAAGSPEISEQAAVSDLAEGESRLLSIPELPFPRALPIPPSGHVMRDLFARPIPLGRETDSGEGVRQNKEEIASQFRHIEFAAKHRLDGVLASDGLRIAVVDGKWVRVGAVLDGCLLQDVEGARAFFRCDDREVVLDLETASDYPER